MAIFEQRFEGYGKIAFWRPILFGLMRVLATVSLFACLNPSWLFAEHIPSPIDELIQSSCIDCHDAETETRINFESLDFQLSDPGNFRKWVQVFDQVDADTMPPKKKSRPHADLRKKALGALETELRRQNIQQQSQFGRAAWRRLTNVEFENTLHDLLSISTSLQHLLPTENTAGFNTSGATQEISSVHVQSYLNAIDRAIETALAQHRSRKPKVFTVDYAQSPYMKVWYDKSYSNGGDNTRPLEDAVVAFKRTDFIWRTDRNGFKAKLPGRYRVRAVVRAYQARSPVCFLLYKAHGDQSQPSLLRAFDLDPEQTRTVELMVELDEDDYLLPSFSQLLRQHDGKSLFQTGAKKYQGEGIAVKTITIEGPLRDRESNLISLLTQKRFNRERRASSEMIQLLKPFLEQAFRGPLEQSDLDWIQGMVREQPGKDKTNFEIVIDAIRHVLTSPQFLYLTPDPGPLDEFSLANRLSFFLTKGPPDSTLRALAESKELQAPEVLTSQIDRLIEAPSFRRFIRDFSSQWLRLKDIDATTPDSVLYPEYNDVLRQAMLDETVLFLEHVFREDLKVTDLMNADFTFMNRELATLYDIPGIKGQHMRYHALPKNHSRGGLLAQAVIHKVTANGTATSPVRRGNFVLTQILGLPSPPPPADAGTLEPDIRGATTIRERLVAHRAHASCNRCHQLIDPPGFALESFDPIGGMRDRYRQLPKKGKRNRFVLGSSVDSSGVTSEGNHFDHFNAFKAVLLQDEKVSGQILRNLTEQLVVYATGTEIQFADRPKIEEIVETVRSQESGLRKLLHLIIQSELFTHR